MHDEVSCIFFLCLPLQLKSSEKGKFQRSLSFARKSSSPQQSLKTSFHFAFGSSIFDLLTQLTLRWAAAGAQRRGDVAALRRPPLRKQTPRKDYWLTFKVVGKLVSTINLFWLGGLFVVRHASSFFLCPKKQASDIFGALNTCHHKWNENKSNYNRNKYQSHCAIDA